MAEISSHDRPPVHNVRKRRKTKRKHDNDIDTTVGLCPWIASLGMTAYESKEQRLHDEIVAYVTYICPTMQERCARELVIASVGELVRRRFPNATMATFGSVSQDLCLPDGDIDLVIVMPYELDHEAKKRSLFQLSAVLKSSLMTRSVQVVHRARVPVISFETIPELGSFKIDISINSMDGVKAVPIIVDYLNKMPALRYLVLVIKSYLSRLRLNSASNGGLSSYSLICLVISFLQQNPKNMPSDRVLKAVEHESLGNLLMDFFDYYGNDFPYESSYISVTQGELLPKESKGWTNTAHLDHLAIECLVNPDHDVGRPTGRIAQVRTAFRQAHLALRNYPFTLAHGNALGTILGISPEMLSHRDHIQEIVNSGSLAQALRRIVLPQPWSGPRHVHPNTRRPRAPYPQVSPIYNGGCSAPSYDSAYASHRHDPSPVLNRSYGYDNSGLYYGEPAPDYSTSQGHSADYKDPPPLDYYQERRPKRRHA
ncbi:hypothetical protein AcV5_005312 [Taiwanofungus camphoratus]|nr:hypothetical protein AcV5_005312 [Antrodia cinnamomea]